MVQRINSKLPGHPGLAKYYDIDEDNATHDIILLMEFINVSFWVFAMGFTEPFNVILTWTRSLPEDYRLLKTFSQKCIIYNYLRHKLIVL